MNTDEQRVESFREEFESWNEEQLRCALNMLQDIQKKGLYFGYKTYKQRIKIDRKFYDRIGLGSWSFERFKSYYDIYGDKWESKFIESSWERNGKWLLDHDY